MPVAKFMITEKSDLGHNHADVMGKGTEEYVWEGKRILDFLGPNKSRRLMPPWNVRVRHIEVFWNSLEEMIAGEFGPKSGVFSPLFRYMSD